MRYGASMLQAVPCAEFAFLPDVGHVPMIDDPDLVAASILEFVAAVEEPSPSAF
jgi:pimeloyl-ACP methyl ester carboxylesterase